MEVIFVLMAIFLILFFMGSYQWVFLFLLLMLYVFLVNASSYPKPMEPTVGTEISPWFDRQRIQNWNPSVPVID